jgi:hypothetical protein
MFLVSLHSIGGFPSGATPVASGPRHWCQFDIRWSVNSSASNVQAARQNTTLPRTCFIIVSSPDGVEKKIEWQSDPPIAPWF